MGMFTSIIHPDTGLEIQIKTGDDFCDTFHVGDNFPTFHDPNVWGSGRMPNEVHDGFSFENNQGCYHWVVIKHGKVHAVVPTKETDDGLSPTVNEVYKQFGIDPLQDNRKFYTPKAYRNYRRRIEIERLKAARHKRSWHKRIEGMSKAEIRSEIGKDMCQPIRRALKYEAIGRRLLMVEELPQKA